MPISREIPTLTFAEAAAWVACNVAADLPSLLMGDPGIGKSALAKLAAGEFKLPLQTLLGSTCDAVDIGGALVPNAKTGSVSRIPLAVIKACVDGAALFFLDEISCAPPSVQAAMLRLILDRVAGDTALHTGTRIIAACNPPEQAAGGFDLAAPLVGRLNIARLRPTETEVIDFLATLGAEGSTLRTEATEFALTAAFAPDLLQIDMPSVCATDARPWGSPRAWERAIRGLAAASDRGLDVHGAHKIAASAVGETCATAYKAIRALRAHLPTVAEIVADPAGAKVPADRHYQIAALGLVARVADANTWAAWIYASRLAPELGQACAARLLTRKDSPKAAPHADAGARARMLLTSTVKRLAS